MKKHLIGKILAVLQGILSIVILVLIIKLNMLPTSFVIFGGVSLAILFAFTFFCQFKDKLHILGKILAVLMCIIMGVGSYYLILTNKLVDNVTTKEVQVDNIIAVVAKDDSANNINDARDYQFGILEEIDREMVNEAIDGFNKMIDSELRITEYDGLVSMVEGFKNGEVQALIYNDSWHDSIEEFEEGFSDTVKILENFKIETAIAELENQLADVDVAKEPFIAYISGVDTRSSVLPTRSRSDVNMMAAVNPTTKQILLIVTPRDYYVEFPGITGGQKDKLTHAGNFGVEASMTTLASIYDVQFNHHLRMNFTSFVDIVNALGNVSVYSDYEFTSMHGNYSFVKGYNAMNGDMALGFARERYSLPSGDFQRGKNQQAVMTAMIKKAMSPSILTGYAGIISAVEGNIDMSMTKDDIASLFKLQLSDTSDWNIVSMAAAGTPASKSCYSLRSNASVVVPDYGSVDDIKVQINKVMNGEIIDEDAGRIYE